MADNEIRKASEAADEVTEKPAFAGYNMNDLRYRRAVVALQKEFARQKIYEDVDRIKHWNPLSPDSKSGKLSNAGKLARKLIGGMNYLDYAMIGFSLFSSTRKLLGFFRPGKKKK